MTTAKHYYECHITIAPVFENMLQTATNVGSMYGFKVAKLLMQKREADTPARSMYDTLMTSHHKDYDILQKRMIECIQHLQSFRFQVYRYKIEDILIDSRIEDNLGLLE